MIPAFRVGLMLWLLAFLAALEGISLQTLAQASQAGQEKLALPEPKELLEKVSSSYRNLKNYHFQIHLLTEIESGTLKKSLESEFDVSVSRPNKSRILVSGALGELQAVADGTETWLFLPELKQYRRQNSAEMEGSQRAARDRASYLASIAVEITREYERLSARVRSARLLPRESLLIENQPVECWVVQTEPDPPADEPDQKTARTYWIDADRLLVLKSVQSTRIEDSDGALETRITTRLKRARTEEGFPESWFVFHPPEGAREVVQFRPPRLGGMELIGQEAADFSLKELGGQEVRLRNLRGRVVLLNFWASWCGPCRLEMPVIEKLHQELGSKGLSVFGINDEDVETIREYLSEYEYTFPTLLDTDQQVARLYRVRGIPTMVVIDRQGIVSHYRVGLSRERDLRSWLKKAGIE